MKKTNLYELRINASNELDKLCLFDEGLFYKEWINFINFDGFEKQVQECLDNFKVHQIKAYYDNDHLFMQTMGDAYELAPKCLKYYTNEDLCLLDRTIRSDYALEVFISLEDAVEFTERIKRDVESWIDNLKQKLGYFKDQEVGF